MRTFGSFEKPSMCASLAADPDDGDVDAVVRAEDAAGEERAERAGGARQGGALQDLSSADRAVGAHGSSVRSLVAVEP